MPYGVDQSMGDGAALYLATDGDDTRVRAENPVHGSDQQSCSPSRPAMMITNQVPCGSSSS